LEEFECFKYRFLRTSVTSGRKQER
jgi:hypothetical protein